MRCAIFRSQAGERHSTALAVAKENAPSERRWFIVLSVLADDPRDLVQTALDMATPAIASITQAVGVSCPSITHEQLIPVTVTLDEADDGSIDAPLITIVRREEPTGRGPQAISSFTRLNSSSTGGP